MLSNAAIQWLESRGLDPELAAKLGWTSSGSGDGEKLAIPYLVGTEAVNHKYRRLGEKAFSQDKGATKCFWNFQAICDPTLADQPLVITEGELDALAAMQCGFVRVVSVPDGAPAEQIGEAETRKYDYLEHAKAALRDVREIILATDGDGPGVALMNDLALRIGRAKCKWVQYPRHSKETDQRAKDLNEVLQRHGEKGVRAVIERAQWCAIDGVYRMSELRPLPEKARYSTGMAFLDEHFMIRLGDFSVVTGIPGDGKSTWVNDVLCRLVSAHGWTVAVASFEQEPQTDHRRALRQWFCRKPVKFCSGAEIAAADEWIDRHFVFIVPSEDDLANLKWVLERAATAVIRHCARIVVIDPWNELDHDRPPDMTLTEYTGLAIKEFKRLGRHLQAHIMVVAHPTKLQRGDRASLYSISDSAHWANKPDVGIVIRRPDRSNNDTICDVVKTRYHDQIGRPGEVKMSFNPVQLRFDELPAELGLAS